MFWSIVGYIRIKVTGENTYQFLNQCRKSSVELHNIKHRQGALYAELKSRDLKACNAAAADYGLDITVCSAHGLYTKLKACKKRKMFAVAFFAMLILFALNTLYISKITIKGNNIMTDSQILSLLAQNGVEKGSFRFSVDQRSVQKNMVADCELLSWVWVDVKGTHAMVEVREKVSMPEFFDKNRACNIIASRDGVITQAVASGGILYAKAGTYVRKGDLLIGGVYDSSAYAPVRFVHAAGEVYAKTTYSLEGDFANQYIKYTPSEKTKNVYGIRVGNFHIGKDISASDVLLTNDTEKKLKIFGKFYLPLAFTKRQYCEIIEINHKLEPAQTEEYALSELATRLNLIIPDGASVVNSEKEVTRADSGKLHVKLTYECIENIGIESPIQFTE